MLVCMQTVHEGHLLKAHLAYRAESGSGSALCVGILAFTVLPTPECRQAGMHVCNTRHAQGPLKSNDRNGFGRNEHV